MQVTVFGASGKVGRLVVEQLLAEGHSVVAFTHSQAPFQASDKLTIMKGDIHDQAAVTAAVVNSQAVISVLGSWGTKSKDILSSAMRTVIPAMQNTGLSRLVSLTGSGAHAPADQITLGDKLSHAVFGLVAKKIIVDAEKHLQLLNNSDLDWTVIRAPVMHNAGRTTYRLDMKLPKAWETISRSAVAQSLIDQLVATDYLRAAPHIHGV